MVHTCLVVGAVTEVEEEEGRQVQEVVVVAWLGMGVVERRAIIMELQVPEETEQTAQTHTEVVTVWLRVGPVLQMVDMADLLLTMVDMGGGAVITPGTVEEEEEEATLVVAVADMEVLTILVVEAALSMEEQTAIIAKVYN